MNDARVEVSTVLQGDGSTLGAFLYHPEPDGRVKAETVLYEEGAQFVVYPHVHDLAPVEGTALVADSTLTITVGPLYVISPLEIPADAVKSAKRVALYFLCEPFQAGDRTEKTILAASLPLDILERGSVA